MKDVGQEQRPEGFIFERQPPRIDYLVRDIGDQVRGNDCRLKIFQITGATAEFNHGAAHRRRACIIEQAFVPIIIAALEQRTLPNQ